ncbi:hypothetical protein D0862_04186 [Hortaea werneckii]|uniref:DUF1349 domain-containing protein n=1 Tax=Hortaea werneckii TaxID=91943 RepID=A0A3M7H3F2_HORWE|nr:hypothetical protein D0862_04186 [Hortaea werneckii]
MASSTWQAGNGAALPKDLSTTFSITTPPKVDIWRRSETDDTFNAPYIYRNVSAKSFKSISVTVSGPWKTQFDQGGLILVLPNKNGLNRWIKAGVEFFNGKPMLGVVGTDRYSDWSLAPMSKGENTATFEAVRDGETLWVYEIRDGERLPLREVKWAFIDEMDEISVGVYAAKPTPEEGDEDKGIDVDFKDLKLETD